MEKKENKSSNIPKFGVEHCLAINVSLSVEFPVQNLYDPNFISQLREVSSSFHIYLIGYVPKFNILDFIEYKGGIFINVLFQGKDMNIPLENTSDLYENKPLFTEDDSMEISYKDIKMSLLKYLGKRQTFDVKYIGQSFGKDGSRDAIDRLLSHETLQKILVKGVPDGFSIHIILLELDDDYQVITSFSPIAEEESTTSSRIENGLDKLYNTSEAERVSLFEAAAIRYFAPEFNKEFKDSFPSTNLKVLKDCYDKDFLGLNCEICFNDFPYYLSSTSISPRYHNVMTFNLQNDKDRKIFFNM